MDRITLAILKICNIVDMRYHLRTKYERENRAEEVAIVTKVISEEEANEIREYDDD